MRFLFVNGHLHVGGVERSLVNLLKAFDYSRHQVDLLLVEDQGELLTEIPPEVRVIYLDLKPTYGSVFSVFSKALSERNGTLARQKAAITAANKLDKRILRVFPLPGELRNHYDCAIAYRVGMPLDLVSYAVHAEKKIAWWHHGAFDYPDYMVTGWNNAFKRVDHIACVSEASRRIISPHFPGLEEKMCVIPNMIIPEEIKKAAEAFEPFEKEEGKTILVSVGRMSAEKHMIDTVDAMRLLVERGHRDVIWYLVGDGVERSAIEQRIREYGLETHFRLVGNQPNPYPYVKKADVFVHPSRVESQGLTVLEAMALGKLCVVVRSEGTDEFVRDEINALSAEPSILSLTDRIESAIALEKAHAALPDGLKTAERYTPKQLLSRLLNLTDDR